MNEELQVKIEQALIAALNERRKEQGLTIAQLGIKAFPGAVNGRMKIQSLTSNQRNGKPRSLKVSEFVSIAKALGLDPTRLLGNVLDLFEETRV